MVLVLGGGAWFENGNGICQLILKIFQSQQDSKQEEARMTNP